MHVCASGWNPGPVSTGPTPGGQSARLPVKARHVPGTADASSLIGSPASRLRAASRRTPITPRWPHMRARASASFSPMPPVNMIVPTPPNAALMAASCFPAGSKTYRWRGAHRCLSGPLCADPAGLRRRRKPLTGRYDGRPAPRAGRIELLLPCKVNQHTGVKVAARVP